MRGIHSVPCVPFHLPVYYPTNFFHRRVFPANPAIFVSRVLRRSMLFEILIDTFMDVKYIRKFLWIYSSVVYVFISFDP